MLLLVNQLNRTYATKYRFNTQFVSFDSKITSETIIFFMHNRMKPILNRYDNSFRSHEQFCRKNSIKVGTIQTPNYFQKAKGNISFLFNF